MLTSERTEVYILQKSSYYRTNKNHTHNSCYKLLFLLTYSVPVQHAANIRRRLIFIEKSENKKENKP